jgi:S-adenosylmethionine/arginine decarboxylase-like enzyme
MPGEMLNIKEMNQGNTQVPVHHARGEQALFSYAFSEPVNPDALYSTFARAITRSHCTAIPKKGFSDDTGIYKILKESSAVLANIDGVVVGSIFTCGDTAKPAEGEAYLREHLQPSVAEVEVIKRGIDVSYDLKGFGFSLKGERIPEYQIIAHHTAIHFGGIPEAVLNNGAVICSYIEKAYLAAGKQVMGQSMHRFQPQGVTIISVFGEQEKVEGRFEIHTYPEYQQALIDIVKYEHGEHALITMLNSLDNNFQPKMQNIASFSMRNPKYILDPFGMKSYAKRQEVA